MERDDGHWTDNPEMIERFVLHELNPDKLNELEDHLRVCEVCKKAVRSEQIVVAGIRKSGRERFKIELRKKLAEVPEERAPWDSIMAAAAVVVILFSLAYYNRWFTTQEPGISNTVIAQAPRQQGEPEPSLKSEPATPLSGPTEARRESFASRVDQPSRTMASKAIAAADKLADEERQQQSKAPTVMTELDRSADVGALSSAGENADLWVEGKILTTQHEEPQAAPSMAKKEARSRMASEAAKDARMRSNELRVQQHNVQSQNLTLRQQNTTELAPQQQIQQKTKPGVVFTKIQRVDDETQLTLYLDSLLDENELANARIETPTSDSLIVSFSNQRIGYRLPEGWNRQVQVKPAK
ncbi:MAG: hypothetical protein HY961_14135 [Ignavibacteriae bacterium]|nr:hypothetical protein [Ignavibacteriota bacterium]